MTSTAPQIIEPNKAELILAQLDGIPPLSHIATKILLLTEDAKTNASQIVELIRTDPALTARILSILNRAERGVRTEVVNVENAVRMLGFNTIRQITLASKVIDVFEAGEPSPESNGLDRTEFWKHCLAVACASRMIAEVLGGKLDPEEAFVCGLLHDIGKMALQAVMPKSFERIVRTARETGQDIADVERQLLGVDHAVVGHRLGDRWGLPSRLIECIWLHHHAPEALPPSVATGRHVQIVQLADVLAREQRIGDSGNRRAVSSSGALSEQLGLSDEARRGIILSLGEEIEKRAAWIGAEEINAREVYLRALLQTTEELSTANAKLAERNKRFAREAEYFAAMRGLNQAVSPRASVRDVCGASASALRRALAVSTVLVFVTDDEGRWVEVGLCDGGEVTMGIEPRAAEAPSEAEEAAAAVEIARAGTWIAPPTPAFAAIVDRYRGKLGAGPLWLFPIVRELRWVGGALFAAPASDVAALRVESGEMESLSAAVGLAISQAKAHTAAVVLGDELSEVNRRLLSVQSELLQAKTLETIVAMAAGAAHELNNPLTVISGRAQMLRERFEDEDVRESLDAIAKQAHICSGIVTELMEFALKPKAEPRPIDLASSLEALGAELAGEGLLEAAELTLDIASDTPQVRFDHALLGKLFRELIRNAVEATEPPARHLTVKANKHLTEEYVAVSVIDNGRGMTADVLESALNPFFSHRPAGRGRGLGLARVQRWLQQGDGSIRIESEPDRGTRVELKLPIAGATDV